MADLGFFLFGLVGILVGFYLFEANKNSYDRGRGTHSLIGVLASAATIGVSSLLFVTSAVGLLA